MFLDINQKPCNHIKLMIPGEYHCLGFNLTGLFINILLKVHVFLQYLKQAVFIKDILPRRNHIIRPPLANLDQLIFVVSVCEPAPNLLLLDKFIAIAEYKNIKPVVVITKVDLDRSDNIFSVYTKVGIDVVIIDYTDDSTVQKLKSMLAGKISAFTGNSGVGKSTLLNAIDSTLGIKTGEISKKLGRGRHTTRESQLYKLEGGGYIADTPGFSTFETNKYDIIKKEVN